MAAVVSGPAAEGLMVAEAIPSNSSAGLRLGPTRRGGSVWYSARGRRSHGNMDAQVHMRWQRHSW